MNSQRTKNPPTIMSSPTEAMIPTESMTPPTTSSTRHTKRLPITQTSMQRTQQTNWSRPTPENRETKERKTAQGTKERYSTPDTASEAAPKQSPAVSGRLPFYSKSYFPPAPIFHADIFRYVMTQFETDTGPAAHTMTQMSANAGIKKHGRTAQVALMAEFSKLEDLSMYKPLDPSKLTQEEQKKAALWAINLIKEKQCRKHLGRTVEGRRSQRTLYEKSETPSPTVANDSLMISIACDALERWDVGTADIAGAYLKAYMKDYVIMKFSGMSVDILCETNPNYSAFVTIENGTRVIYICLIKAIYGVCAISTPLLGDVLLLPAGNRFCIEPLQLLRCEQNHQRETTYHRMVRGWHENFARSPKGCMAYQQLM